MPKVANAVQIQSLCRSAQPAHPCAHPPRGLLRDGRRRLRPRPEGRCCAARWASPFAPAGRCVFYLSVSGRSLTALEGLGPSTQKTKTERRRRDFVVKTLQNVRVSMHSGHPSNSATIPSLHRPTRPTRPVDHPTGRPAHHLPPFGPTLGTRPDGPLSPGPLPPPPCFLFFVFMARSQPL